MSGNTGETPRSSPTAASDANAPKTLLGKKALPRWLGLVAGWFDVVNMQQYGCYCNMMSGNTLNFSMKLVASMIRMYDADRTAQLSFPQFCELHKFLCKVQRVFGAADHDRSNQLDLNEIFNGLTSLGYQLDRQPGGSFYTRRFSSPAVRSHALKLAHNMETRSLHVV